MDSHVEEIAEACYAGVCTERDPFWDEPPAHWQVQWALRSLCSMRRITGIPRSDLKLGGG